MTRVAIVGHGPSMLESRQGALIDQYDIVVRLKRCQDTLRYPELYGTRTDIVCGSYTIARALKGIGGAKQYWVCLDSRHTGVTVSERNELIAFFSPATVRIDVELCNYWDEKYRERRDSFTVHPQMKQGDYSNRELGHNHSSIGTKALIHACHFIKPKAVHLFGFDNLASGRFTWSITRGPQWDGYPDHRWDVENKLVPEIANYFGVDIRFENKTVE